MRRASACGRTSLSPCFVPGCRFAPLKIAAMTPKMVGFAEKRNVDSARKRLHPAKNVCFSNITVSNLCHCEERSDVAILKPKAWHPVTKHGSTKQEEIPITKNMDSLLHSASSPFIYGSVSFRATIVRYGMANRFVKDCRVGRTRPPRNDKSGGFCGKTEQFPERNV